MLFWLVSCGPADEATQPKYRTTAGTNGLEPFVFAVHPLHNPAKLLSTYQPLVDLLAADGEGPRLLLEASRNYGAFEKKILSRGPALLLPNPWQTLRAMERGYHVICMAGDAADFKGLWIVRRDGGIRVPSDLKGKAVSYPSPTALAACIMPQYFLHRSGLDMKRDLTHQFVGSQESSILNVYLGRTAAGATWPPPWRAFQREHPREAEALRVAWETESLINNSVMIRDDLPAGFGAELRRRLLKVHETPEGRAVLAGMETSRFYPATDADYAVAARFIARFEAEVRKVEP